MLSIFIEQIESSVSTYFLNEMFQKIELDQSVTVKIPVLTEQFKS